MKISEVIKGFQLAVFGPTPKQWVEAMDTRAAVREAAARVNYEKELTKKVKATFEAHFNFIEVCAQNGVDHVEVMLNSERQSPSCPVNQAKRELLKAQREEKELRAAA
jgi:hypothetical protein